MCTKFEVSSISKKIKYLLSFKFAAQLLAEISKNKISFQTIKYKFLSKHNVPLNPSKVLTFVSSYISGKSGRSRWLSDPAIQYTYNEVRAGSPCKLKWPLSIRRFVLWTNYPLPPYQFVICVYIRKYICHKNKSKP